MSTVPWWADPDPWALSPDEQAKADELRRKHEAERAATSDHPPF
jgi:hypothetical protein